MKQSSARGSGPASEADEELGRHAEDSAATHRPGAASETFARVVFFPLPNWQSDWLGFV